MESYTRDALGKVLTKTLPCGKSIETLIRSDGRLVSKTGDSIVDEFYHYFVDTVTAGGQERVRTYYGTDSSSSWTEQRVDWLGRPTFKKKNTSAGVFTLNHNYNSDGQLTSLDPDGIGRTLFEYNNLGEMVSSGLNGDGSSGDVLDTGMTQGHRLPKDIPSPYCTR